MGRSTMLSVLSSRFYLQWILLVFVCGDILWRQRQQLRVVNSFHLQPKNLSPPQQWNARTITPPQTFIKTTTILPPSLTQRPSDSIKLYSFPPDTKKRMDFTPTTNKTITKTFTIYKDDCFGFITFLAGIGTKDGIFVGMFVLLSLISDAATRLGYLPPDPKRPTIVDRKIPGIVAAITVGMTPLLSPVITPILDDVIMGSSNSMPEPASYALWVQLVVCSFSMITAFFDIRWRDRFDYPEEYYQNPTKD